MWPIVTNDPLPIDSEALRANAPHTALEITISSRYRPLLDAVEGYPGVLSSLTDTLREYFHGYRHVDSLIDGFSTILLRNWTYFERADARGEVFTLFCELVTELLGAELTETQFSSLLRVVFSWISKVCQSPFLPEYEPDLLALGERLNELIDTHSDQFLERDRLLHEAALHASPETSVGVLFRTMYRRVVDLGYRELSTNLDVPTWARSAEAGLTDPEGIAAAFAFLGQEEMAERRRQLAEVSLADITKPEIRSTSQLVSEILGTLPRCEQWEDRFAVCLFLLKDTLLRSRQQEAFYQLLSIVKHLVQPGRNVDAERILTRLTSFFSHRGEEFLQTRMHCYEVIGTAIGQAGNVRAADKLLDDILVWRFQYPEIAGATDDWQTVVNPFHLPKVRCWLRIIESNPPLFERLAAALDVQLRLGGVHISDTDLFQRDITRLLNSNIGPVYFVIKQLLRVFPVYFTEVGAEGELRGVSTRFDELSQRRDTLLHFLRKQVHAESSNRLVPFSREVMRYWLLLDDTGVEPYVSDNTLAAMRDERAFTAGPHALLTALRRMQFSQSTESEGFLDWLLTRDVADLRRYLQEAYDADESDVTRESDVERVACLARTHQLLTHKYSLSADDLRHDVDHHLALAEATRHNFLDALDAWRDDASEPNRDTLVDAGLDVLEELKAVICDPTPTTADENLYYKRHIAAGIPSIYGSYREPKFDALSLSFRVEDLVSRLLEDIVNEPADEYVTRDSLRRMTTILQRFKRTLAIDGVDSQQLDGCLNMLTASFGFHSFTFHQYQNVFKMLAHAMTGISSRSVRSHGGILRQALQHDSRQCERRNLSIDGVAEMVLREILVSALGMQTLDRYIGAALRRFTTLTRFLDEAALTRMMNYDPKRLVWPLHGTISELGDAVTLGGKGFGLQQMAANGVHVPEGFILSTELFHAQAPMAFPPLYDEMVRQVRVALANLEASCGRRYADPHDPLLLSVRSGSPISMPGLMTTFVNVGMSDEVAEALSRKPDFEWTSWDSYRRFLQSWAMNHGVHRSVFDGEMRKAKQRHGVDRKLQFSPSQMKELAQSYKRAAIDHGVTFFEDPFEQLIGCILRVVASWNGEDATLYRRYLDIAENWGTAVLCQRMVFGNINQDSGSGVVLTRSPFEPTSQQVRLFGDFAIASQGEDLVGGLVFPLPISEHQREAMTAYRDAKHSMETMFPDVYAELLRIARQLVSGPGSDPQEIEFTFESPAAKDLYILQQRAAVQEEQDDAPYFDSSAPEFATPAATGMAVSGGAYAGRVAFTNADLDALVAEDAEQPLVLLRPDTVPEDLSMITRVDGLLTARGGATSHAAVTAKRLGKTAVVECHALEVHRDEFAMIAGQRVDVGDWLSIDGRTGSIFLGRLPLSDARPGSGGR